MDTRLFNPHTVLDLIGDARAHGMSTATIGKWEAWLADLMSLRTTPSLAGDADSGPATTDNLDLAEPWADSDFIEAHPTPVQVTYVVLARNEADGITRCLDSIPDDAAILLIDTGSTDRTRELALAHPRNPTVVHEPWTDSFAAARNSVRQHVHQGWVVFIDADEVVAPGHGTRIAGALRALDRHPSRGALGGEVFIADSLGGPPGSVPRIFHVHGVVSYRGRIHERLVCCRDGAVSPVTVAKVDACFLHDGYRPAAIAAKDKLARNSRLIDLALGDEPERQAVLFYLARDGAGFGDFEASSALYERVLEQARTLGITDGEEVIGAAAELMAVRVAALDFPGAAAVFAANEGILPARLDLEFLNALARFNVGVEEIREAQHRLARFLRDHPGADQHSLSPGGEHAESLIGLMAMATGRFDVARRCWELVGENIRPNPLGEAILRAAGEFAGMAGNG